MQQASALLTPGRTNPSLRGQTRRFPGKTKWAAARLTTRAKQPKDARRVSRLSPHASVGAGADTSPSDDTHDDKTAFTILARNSPGVLQVRRRVTHFKRPKYLAGKVTLTVPRPVPALPERRPYRPRSPTQVSTSAPSTPPRTRSTPHCPTSRWSSRLSGDPSSRWTLWTFPRRGEFIFHLHIGN